MASSHDGSWMPPVMRVVRALLGPLVKMIVVHASFGAQYGCLLLVTC